MRSPVLVLLLLGACTFAWDDLDPRGLGGEGGMGLGGGGAATASTTTSTSGPTTSGGGQMAMGGGGAGGAGGDMGTGGTPLTTITVTLGERPTCDISGVTKDAFLDESNPTLNFGTSSSIRADINGLNEVRGLLKFDLSPLPSNAQITSAEIRLFTGSGENAQSNEAVRFFELTESWSEGVSSGLAGVSNWNEREPNDFWSDPGAGPSSRRPQPFASVTMSTVGTEYTVPVPAALAQAWLNAPNQNYGMVLEVEVSDGVSIRSSNSSVAPSRPMMVVTYAMP